MEWPVIFGEANDGVFKRKHHKRDSAVVKGDEGSKNAQSGVDVVGDWCLAFLIYSSCEDFLHQSSEVFEEEDRNKEEVVTGVETVPERTHHENNQLRDGRR